MILERKKTRECPCLCPCPCQCPRPRKASPGTGMVRRTAAKRPSRTIQRQHVVVTVYVLPIPLFFLVSCMLAPPYHPPRRRGLWRRAAFSHSLKKMVQHAKNSHQCCEAAPCRGYLSPPPRVAPARDTSPATAPRARPHPAARSARQRAPDNSSRPPQAVSYPPARSGSPAIADAGPR